VIYEYFCEQCKSTTDVYKSLAEIDREERCPGCPEILMHRIITQAQVDTSGCQHEAKFHHAFGKVLSSKRQIKNEISRIKSETGREIVEVGNDSLKSIQKKRKAYTID
jgi:putative FmdB family regulatory protein